jgi:hypothetical protein
VNLSRKVQPDPEGSSTPELPIVPLAGFVERQGEETDSNLAAKSRGFLQKAEMACFTGQGVRVRGGQACAETAQCVPPFETHRNIGEWRLVIPESLAIGEQRFVIYWSLTRARRLNRQSVQ